MKTITDSTLALDLIRGEYEIVYEILEMFDSNRCYNYDVFENLKEYVYGISIFIKDLEYIKSILKKVCDRIPEVRDDNLPGLTSKGYQEELNAFISNLEYYTCDV